MKHLLTVVLLLYSLVSLGQSAGPYEVNGTIFESPQQPLEGVLVTLKCDSLELKTTTDNYGNYSIKYKSANPCVIRFSKEGYKPSGGTFQPQPLTTISIPLERDEKTVNLKEVTVKGSRVITNGNKTTYLPDENQTKASHDGIDLLFQLGIPQLEVNPMTGSVASADKSDVAFYIENRKVTLTEIGQLRAKDIKSVEYYDNAVDRFPGEQKVLNYVLYHYEAGGYVDVATDTRLIDRSGKYNAQVSLDTKKVNFVLLGGIGMQKDDGLGNDQTEKIALDNPFAKTSSSLSGVNKSRNYNSLFRTTYNTKRTTVVGQAALSLSRVPRLEQLSATEYSPAVYPNSTADDFSKQRSSTFTATAFLRHNFNDVYSLDWRVVYNYSDNNYHRRYSETDAADPILSHTKEYLNNVDTRLNYRIKLNSASSLGLFVWETYTKSKDRYLYAENGMMQNLESNEFQLYPTYQTMIGSSLSLNMQAGFDVSSYKAKDCKRQTKVWPRPVVTVNWRMSSHNTLMFDARMGSSYPTMNTFTAAQQRVNFYEVLQGNPALGTTRIVDAVIAHSLTESHFQLSSYVGYSQLINVMKNDYQAHGQTLIHSYITDGNYRGVDAGINAALFLFDRSLQLKGGAGYHHQSLTGDYAAHNNIVSYNLDMMYYRGKFNAYAFFRPTQKYLFSSPEFVRTCPSYGMAAGWSDNGWKSELGVRNIFTKSKPYYEFFDFNSYAYDKQAYSDRFGPQVYLKLSYSFDFGRKIKHENIEQDAAPQSGILHP
ncbi:TonB-dependent receptor [Prevotella lacticifex]|uniref:TonB-dependent receptor n=1 Tax=Prevotella lacticifex TaxID=2854755 RepID=A0A9R1CXZ7_9BACT|nr:TonB-dependent receptor [Prevotella lacticifex]GJG35334.1 hypothetical protein PRLR5003_04910 [Prevotella lacticifex]GJG39615.1 hypothetical protein PRLR5019_15860 [Prevotella lacticifex]GJG41703.1 hypothetical protein PRLR5025_04890 [Prevotella lacticifex]GJG45971.1 hypothetical protein PRLR5027_15660 [Prevotella lacticifex]GJG48054.1 hypothetical protein PRLR5052_04670 [Prevotella lacticifex]